MSKEVGELSYEEVDQVWKDCGASASPANMRYEFARSIQEKLAGRCRAQGGNTSDNITPAAANKAAEEGGLPYGDALDTIAANAAREVGGIFTDAIPIKSLVVYARAVAKQAIAAGRASRQVANKAEVEPVAFMYQDDQDLAEPGTGSCVVSKARCNFYRNETPLYATPPATTGASTVDLRNDEVFDELLGDYGDSFGKLTGNIDPEPIYQYIEQAYAKVGASTAVRPTDDELWDATLRDRDAYHEWADKLADAIAKHFGVDIGEHSNQNLPWAEALEAIENAEPAGASTVLTDERIIEIALEAGVKVRTGAGAIKLARAIEREAAAQAGQVAVPEDVARDAARYRWMRSFAYQAFELVFHDDGTLKYGKELDEAIDSTFVIAAPSPAKESK